MRKGCALVLLSALAQGVAFADAAAEALIPTLTFTQSVPDAWQVTDDEISIANPSCNGWNGDPAIWIEAEVDGEAILSFDLDYSATCTSSWMNAVCQLQVLVDGEAVDIVGGLSESSPAGVYCPSWSKSRLFFIASDSGSATRPVNLFLTPGSHRVRWQICYAGSSNCETKLAVRNLNRKVVGMQSTIFDLLKLTYDYGVLRPGNMAYLRDSVYSECIKKDPNDYEARILRAAATLGALADNAKARALIGQCGYVVADYTFRTAGSFAGFENAPLSNEIVDEMIPEALAAADSALADLTAIPEDWDGQIEFLPEKYGFPAIVPNEHYKKDRIYVGLAEVSLARAAVEMFRAQLKLAKGYDYEADYIAVTNAVLSASSVHEVLASAPKAGTIRNAADLLAAKEDFRAALASVHRADAAIVARGDYKTYLIAYDRADAEEIEAWRTLLNEVEATLDATNTVDLTFLAETYDTNGVLRANLPGGKLSRELFLGAVFAGKVTRGLVPDGAINRETNRVNLHMRTIDDPTWGGLLPWMSVADVASVYPWTQEWDVTAYLASRPAVKLARGQELIVTGEAVREAPLVYSSILPGSLWCVRDSTETVASDIIADASAVVTNTVSCQQGSTYAIHFSPQEKMTAAQTPVDISLDDSPMTLPDGRPYIATVNGVNITFEIVDGEAWIGTSAFDNGVPEETTGDVTIPAQLGGRPVVGIHTFAFCRCRQLSHIVFMGDEPSVEEDAFRLASCKSVQVTRSAAWPNPLPDTWQGFDIGYIPALDSRIVVTPSQASGTFSFSTTLALSADEGKTVYYTLDGTEPTRASSTYASPLAISETQTVTFFAVDDETEDWGPVGSVTLTRVASESPRIAVTPSATNGTHFVGSQTVTLSASGGETVYFTLDGTDPKTSETRQVYAESLVLDATTTLSYYAVDSVHGDWSAVETVRYVLQRDDGGPYSETVDGVTWWFWIVDGKASVGKADPTNGQSGSSEDMLATDSENAVLVIPSELGGWPVRGISEWAFFKCSTLELLFIPEGLTAIGDFAFSYCSSLRSISLPSSLTSLGQGSFHRNSSLVSIHFSGNAPECDVSAVSGVSSVCRVSVERGSTGWGDVPGVWCGLPTAYADDSVFSVVSDGLSWNYRNDGQRVSLQRSESLRIADLAVGAVTIPSAVNGASVQVLGKGLLQGAAKVTSVVVPAGVTEIESSVFRECSRLECVDLPEGLSSIGDSAFRECVSLTDVTIPASVTNIGYFAFRDCLRLTNVTLKGEAPRRDLGAFMGVPAFTTVSGRLGSATALVYASVTNATEEITVPESWLEELALAHDKPAGAASYEAAFVERFGSDLRAALTKPTGKRDLKGNALCVWQDYVAGTDPLDEEDVFTATITMADGVPVVSWAPELSPTAAVKRKYTVYGATALDGQWTDVSGLTDAQRQERGYQFFWVTVEMR